MDMTKGTTFMVYLGRIFFALAFLALLNVEILSIPYFV